MAATAAFSTPNSSPRLPLFSYRTTTTLPPFSITIRSSIADRPSTLSANAPAADLPLRKIPGDYGFPLLGSIKDRFAYFYTEGCDAFFRSRIRRYNSTVFRVNMPPGPPISADPRVIALLDAVSFPILFDTSAVEKRDLFTGTFMPSTDLTGGYRVLLVPRSLRTPSRPAQEAPLLPPIASSPVSHPRVPPRFWFSILISRIRFIKTRESRFWPGE
ncbi:hypothetical protein KFK09_014742 [Dendrobium nobile]|uniref:Uncharacterized protein n=1 Tax=Dendrobium nobile TaxID=94219 RepID=A0A8T3B4T0_DENNO|nr:hypothetical protein KFK09_014742 [Dendrobium nobile]